MRGRYFAPRRREGTDCRVKVCHWRGVCPSASRRRRLGWDHRAGSGVRGATQRLETLEARHRGGGTSTVHRTEGYLATRASCGPLLLSPCSVSPAPPHHHGGGEGQNILRCMGGTLTTHRSVLAALLRPSPSQLHPAPSRPAQPSAALPRPTLPRPAVKAMSPPALS